MVSQMILNWLTETGLFFNECKSQTSQDIDIWTKNMWCVFSHKISGNFHDSKPKRPSLRIDHRSLQDGFYIDEPACKAKPLKPWKRWMEGAMSTPRKIHILEPQKNEGLVQMNLLFKPAWILRFQPWIFRGDPTNSTIDCFSPWGIFKANLGPTKTGFNFGAVVVGIGPV